MLFDGKMKPEEETVFFERWRKINEEFPRLDQSSQKKVMDKAASLYWRKLAQKSLGSLMALKIMCRILDEPEEVKIVGLIEKLAGANSDKIK